MVLVLDAAVHMGATGTAGITLDGRLLVDDLQLVAIRADAQLIAADDGYDREQRALGLPALGAAAHVIEGGVALERYGHRRGAAQTGERPSREIRLAGLHTIVDSRMDLD